MSELEQSKVQESLDAGAEQQTQPITVVPTEEAIGSTALTAAKTGKQVMALDDQAPRSWDLHKSGW